jgi:hypothetical protein
MFNEEQEEEIFWNPERRNLHPDDFVMDEENDILWIDIVNGFLGLVNKYGHNGPFTWGELEGAITLAVVERTINSLVKEGLVEKVWSKGEWCYKLTDETQAAFNTHHPKG